MVTGRLSRGTELRLKSDHVYPLEMSPRGGEPSSNTLEVKAGTRVAVAEDCAEQIWDIPVHLLMLKESLAKRANGKTFFASRPFLEVGEAVQPTNGACQTGG